MNFANLRNRYFFALDAVLLCLIPSLALMLRLDMPVIPARFVFGLIVYTFVALIIRLTVFYLFGLYRHFWRYASIEELSQIGFAVFIGTVLTAVGLLVIRFFIPFSFARSVLIIDSLVVLLVVGGTRFSVRLHANQRRYVPIKGSRRVLVIGAGDAGDMVVRELQSNPRRGLNPVGFVDDDPAKHNMQIHGLPVWGNRRAIPYIIEKHQIDQVIIAMPTASGKVLREVVETCERVGVPAKTIPAIYEIVDSTIKATQLRDVELEDLLRRAPVHTDIQAVQTLIVGKRVLVTGAGGSIGSELCRQVLRCRPAELLLLGHGENSIFDVYHDLRRLCSDNVILTPIIADVRSVDRIEAIFRQHRPQIVFHAAAHKHVPLMELNPCEAITNNVVGTHNLLKAAVAYQVDHFVMISTDKAVNPTNIMGASKRAAELLVHQAAKESQRPFVAVRFGNVLGSRGSVVPFFKKQLAAGGPLTVTHPDVTRFFMTIPEAVQLVLQAAVLGNGGELFTLDMGEPVKILDLARDLIELSGLEVGRDVEIVFTGMRPGEKLYEELFIAGEEYCRTQHEKIFIADNASSFVPANLETAVAQLKLAAQRGNNKAVIQGLCQLIPEFQPLIDRTTAEPDASNGPITSQLHPTPRVA